jgi:hypothetical protein
MKGTVGWRDEWDEHVLHIAHELMNDIDLAAERAWKSDKAMVDVFKAVDLDFKPSWGKRLVATVQIERRGKVGAWLCTHEDR